MATDVVCPICAFSTKHENILNTHCVGIHSLDPEQMYRDCTKASNICGCGCGATLQWGGWRRGYSKYIRGHNANVSTAFSDPSVIKRSVKKRKEGLASGRLKVWNEGLTKETSESLRTASEKKSMTSRRRYSDGELVPWQLDPARKESLEKAKATRNQKLQSGEISVWNKGLTKHDSRVGAIAAKISKKMCGKSTRRIPLEELQRRLSAHSDRLIFCDDLTFYTSKYQRLKFRCVAQNHISEKTLRMYELNPVCFECHPKESTAQLDIADFVRSLGCDISLSDRSVISPKELDVYVIGLSFAIEYNSLYYHSEKCMPERNYHDDKTVKSCAAGVTLFHVFEDEWRDSRPIIESMIRHRLHVTPKKYYARKLTLQRLTQADMGKFFDTTHIDGHVRAETGFGLIDEAGTIVSAMSVRIPSQRRLYSGTLEIARYSSALNTHVVGGTSRLLSAVCQYARESGRTKVMTYVDTRHGTGVGYESAGMQRADDTGCRFWWTDGRVRYDRFKFRADKSRGMSESDIAAEAGVWKIWGCRNRVYVMSAGADLSLYSPAL